MLQAAMVKRYKAQAPTCHARALERCLQLRAAELDRIEHQRKADLQSPAEQTRQSGW